MMQTSLDFTPTLHTQTQLAAQQPVWRQIAGTDRAAALMESERLQAQGHLVLLGALPDESLTHRETILTALEWVMVVALLVAFVLGMVDMLERVSTDDIVDWMLNLRAGTARLG